MWWKELLKWIIPEIIKEVLEYRKEKREKKEKEEADKRA